jgi:hypothetical protein
MSHQHTHQHRFSDLLLFDPPFGKVKFRPFVVDASSVSGAQS